MKKIELQRVAPADIEARSMEIIGQELGERVFPADQLPVYVPYLSDMVYAKKYIEEYDRVHGEA